MRRISGSLRDIHGQVSAMGVGIRESGEGATNGAVAQRVNTLASQGQRLTESIDAATRGIDEETENLAAVERENAQQYSR